MLRNKKPSMQSSRILGANERRVKPRTDTPEGKRTLTEVWQSSPDVLRRQNCKYQNKFLNSALAHKNTQAICWVCKTRFAALLLII